MQNQNISDIIEAYLKQNLAAKAQIEIRRAEIAELFNCVPSQINYVINTRFTVQKGYLVESKRGGGGYIRIEKVQLLDNVQQLDYLSQMVGEEITYKNAFSIIENLYEAKLLTKKEANFCLSSMTKEVLHLNNRHIEEQIRARILKAVLDRLRYES